MFHVHENVNDKNHAKGETAEKTKVHKAFTLEALVASQDGLYQCVKHQHYEKLRKCDDTKKSR
jgi:hypothetical protein